MVSAPDDVRTDAADLMVRAIRSHQIQARCSHRLRSRQPPGGDVGTMLNNGGR
jgi:hypothetical protein